MDTKDYQVTRPDIEWIAGQRALGGLVSLTDAQAAPELARGTIAPVDKRPRKVSATTGE